MSNRDVAPPGSARLEAMLKDYGDRLAALENRRLQGALAIQSATVGALSVGATSTSPLKLNGSKGWTQDIEFLGREHAIVTRNELGQIVDTIPSHFSQFFSGSVSIPTATSVVVPVTAGNVTSGPFTDAASFDIATAAMIAPITGVYDVYGGVAWQANLDATVRRLSFQISSDGGATWNDLVFEHRTALNNLLDTMWHVLTFRTNLTAGNRFRLAAMQRSGVTLSCSLNRFQMSFVRSQSFVPS